MISRRGLFSLPWIDIATMPNGKRRIALIRDFEKVLDSIDRRAAPFEAEAGEHASMLMAFRELQGRQRDGRDTMIAGIVLACHATLATEYFAL